MEKLTVIQSAGPIKFREILKEVQFVEWSKAYVQYEQLRPLVARVGLIRKEKDEAKNYEVRKSSLADAEEALWLAVHQQVDKADAFYKSLVESLDQQYEVVVREMSKVKQLQEFLIKNDLYAPRQMVLAYGHLIVDGFYGPLTRAALSEYKGSGQAEPPEASCDSLDIIADFCCTLDRVQEFVLINYVILAKVLKSHAKRCGTGANAELAQRLNLQLRSTYLFASAGLLDLTHKAEALVAGDVSVGKARVMEGDAWIESRLVYSRIVTLARRFCAEVDIAALPFLEYMKGRDLNASEPAVAATAVGDQAGAAAADDAEAEAEGGALGLDYSAAAKRNVLARAAEELHQSPAAREASMRRRQLMTSSPHGAEFESVSSALIEQFAGTEFASNSRAPPKVFKIALTGGPCAGKTSSLSVISDHFKGLGWRVYVAREAASVMLSGGINFACMNGEQVFELQSAIVKLMLCLEDSYEAICRKGDAGSKCLILCDRGIKCLILCDRGIMDASVYCDADTWQRVLASACLTHSSACDARYSGVVHLVTAADGAEEHYNLDSNAEGVRTETAEQARELDAKIGTAWASHPSLAVIDNSSDFNNKVKRGLAAICGFVGEQAPNFALRRRKFLVSAANLRSSGIHVKTSDCDYTYLISSDHMQHRLRRRVHDGTFLYTHIRRLVMEDGSTMDLKDNINRTRYLGMLSYQDPQRMLIRVVRETFVYKNRQFCLNHVLGMAPAAAAATGRPSPRAVGNVMLLSVWCEDDVDLELPAPPVLTIEREVTGMPQFSLFHLSQAGDDAGKNVPPSPVRKARVPVTSGEVV